MKYILLILLFNSQMALAQKNKDIAKPKLIVGIVLDQMRPDYLTRFEQRLSKGGFMELTQNGHVCENTFINYLPSYTAPGHTCIYTGSVPSLHGIASNDWVNRSSGKAMYCTSDETVKPVGGSDRAGKMSPRNMWATTITDELRLSTNFKSKVIGVSIKDRASILPAGHTANAAYWMDDSLGKFMTSTYYTNELPKWVNDFNEKGYAKRYMDQEWNTLYPLNTYTASTADNNMYEGKFSKETTSSFPHATSTLKLSDIKRTPYGNDILAEFAKTTILEEKMGMGEETDFLALSFSSTDYVGHMYGPNSIEVEDTYLRMDKTIEDLISFLNDKIGEGNYTIFLSADHGVAHNPQFMLDNKIPSGFFFGSTFKTALNNHLATKFNSNLLVKLITENFIWLNDSLLEASSIDRQAVINSILKYTKNTDEIQYAIDMEHITEAVIPADIKEMAINGYVASRSGDILLLLKPSWLDAYSKTGTTHGTWNPYDTHIPLIWYGWGIKKGITYRQVNMTDIAATLASLLHIQMPNACIGKAIPEVIK